MNEWTFNGLAGYRLKYFSCTVKLNYFPTKENKKIQQRWQTSAAVHLPLARLVSISVIFCLLPSSSIVIFVFYLFSTDMSEQHVWELWVWIQFTGLMLLLRVTPVNNPMTLISPVQSLGYIFCRYQYMRSSANFRTVFSESQNANPTVAFFVLIQYRSVTDGRTDGQTDRQTDISPLAIPPAVA